MRREHPIQRDTLERVQLPRGSRLLNQHKHLLREAAPVWRELEVRYNLAPDSGTCRTKTSGGVALPCGIHGLRIRSLGAAHHKRPQRRCILWSFSDFVV